MANIKFNFSSQWPNIQVVKVVASPHTAGVSADYPYLRKIAHGLGYPPFCIGLGPASGATSYNNMIGIDVDATYVYIRDYDTIGWPLLDCVVICSLDITQPFTYPYYASEIGTIQADGSTESLDLRKFLLCSRAVSPMVLSVVTKDYTVGDLTLTYNSPLDYPTFSFGYIRYLYDAGMYAPGTWLNCPLASQAFPKLQTDGYTSILASTTIGGELAADKGSIVVLRNPEIITENSVSVSI